jgi:pyruvate dehydrogenase E2 component (dihydrolipoamide acetyltransferase)
MAVALDDGLIVPVIHNADQKTTAEVANAIADVTVRARQNKLKPNDLSGGTFSISNLGMFGLRRFSAIINPPECAILAVGSMSKRVVVDENNALVIRPVLTLSLSCDHRVVDGADAARFLAELQTVLQSPELML